MSPGKFPRSRSAFTVAAAFVLAACGGDEPATLGPTTTAGGGGSALAGAGSSAAGGGGGSVGGAGASATAGQAASIPAAGSGAAAAAGGGSGATAGAGGAAGATQPPGVARPTECNGKPLPPRAIGKSPPFAVGPEAGGLAGYWPTEAWRTEAPAKLGFDPAKLMAAADFSTEYSTTQAVLVVRHGYIALEKYIGTFTLSSTHESYSMAKSFTSGLIGIAIGEGKLKGTDEKICQYYPMNWDCADAMDPRSRITIDHAMNLMTGLRWSEDWRSTATARNDGFSLNLLDTALAREAVEEPGVTKRYSTGDPALLSGVLQQVTGMTAYEYGKLKVFDVIGANSIRWNSDSSDRTTTYAGLRATARDYAKYGYLYLRRGEWDGKQVVPSDWIDRTTQAVKPCEDWNQYLWHINPPYRLGTQDPACDGIFCTPTDFADLPPDAYFAEGVNGQFVFIIPSADMVVVRLARDQRGSEHWDEFARGFLLAMFAALE